MITAKELKQWAATLEDDAQVYVDQGGLSLVVLADDENCPFDGFSGPYLEVGGLPEEDEEPYEPTNYFDGNGNVVDRI